MTYDQCNCYYIIYFFFIFYYLSIKNTILLHYHIILYKKIDFNCIMNSGRLTIKDKYNFDNHVLKNVAKGTLPTDGANMQNILQN